MPKYSVVLELPDGDRSIVCGNKPMKACGICRGRVSAYLCDFPVGYPVNVKTCDTALCDECKVSKGPDLDWCPTHEVPL